MTIILLLLSHYILDYGYSLTPEMIKAKSVGEPYRPIFKHALFHAIGATLAVGIARYEVPDLLFLLAGVFLTMLTSHFLIDVAKGKLTAKYEFFRDHTNPLHWHLFAFDQFLHMMVIVYIWFSATIN